jgi:hypothetical protein
MKSACQPEYNPFHLSNDELAIEHEADRLLTEARKADPEHGGYSEDYLHSKDIRNRSFPITDLGLPSYIEPAADVSLWEVAWTEIRSGAKKARLSYRQIFILEKRSIGLYMTEICDEWNERPRVRAREEKPMCRQTCAKELKRAVKALEMIPCFGLWSTLAEIFRCPVGRIKYMLLHG